MLISCASAFHSRFSSRNLQRGQDLVEECERLRIERGGGDVVDGRDDVDVVLVGDDERKVATLTQLHAGQPRDASHRQVAEASPPEVPRAIAPVEFSDDLLDAAMLGVRLDAQDHALIAVCARN